MDWISSFGQMQISNKAKHMQTFAWMTPKRLNAEYSAEIFFVAVHPENVRFIEVMEAHGPIRKVPLIDGARR